MLKHVPASALTIAVSLLMLWPAPKGLAKLLDIQNRSLKDEENRDDLAPSVAGEHQIQKPNCFPLTLRIECSSEEIAKGQPVICRVEFPGARPDFKPVIKWSVSKGGSKKRFGGSKVEIMLTDHRVAKIRVTGRVTSPRVCLDTASAELQVVNRRLTQMPHGGSDPSPQSKEYYCRQK